MSTPPIRDSDQKAAAEIKRKWSVHSHHYEGYVVAEDEELALIIARHHAEERAAVEKVEAQFRELREAVLDHNGIPDTHYALDEWPDAESLFTPEYNRMLRALRATMPAAITALRTASQSKEDSS